MAASALPPAFSLNARLLPRTQISSRYLRPIHPSPGICTCSGRNLDEDSTERSLSRRGLIGAGLGILLADPLRGKEAAATRVQYYATVGEKLCDLNFVKSGLGYCDVAVGNGVEPPPGELINVRTVKF